MACAANSSIAKPATSVEREDQVKGNEVENGDYVVLEPEEVASAVPDSDKTLKIEAFVPVRGESTTFISIRPCYLTPDKPGEGAFGLLRDGMRASQGRRAHADGAVSPPAHGTATPAWQRVDRHDAEFRLRSALLRKGLQRRCRT